VFGSRSKTEMVTEERALRGRGKAIQVSEKHFILGTPLTDPFPEEMVKAYFALGCFWGAERVFWQLDGVYSTAVGYAGGFTSNPTYEEVCSSKTGHAETVMVVYDPDKISYRDLVAKFFESHDPTQYMRQGNDIGTQYRSAIFTCSDEQQAIAQEVATTYQIRLKESGFSDIVTEITPFTNFYYAEDYHQQYLGKNPAGYCGLGGTGVSCPTGVL
jgi:peptide-methionine (S)-S-oxide reductase